MDWYQKIGNIVLMMKPTFYVRSKNVLDNAADRFVETSFIFNMYWSSIFQYTLCIF